MAYPTGMLSITLEDIDRRMVRLKQFTQSLRDSSAIGNIISNQIFDLYITLKAERAGLVSAAAVPGIGVYAQNQKGDASLDVVAAFNAVIAAIDGVTNWIVANFPKDANGYLLAQTWGATGPLDRVFTPAQTAGMRTQLDNLISTIA